MITSVDFKTYPRGNQLSFVIEVYEWSDDSSVRSAETARARAHIPVDPDIEPHEFGAFVTQVCASITDLIMHAVYTTKIIPNITFTGIAEELEKIAGASD